MPNIYSSILLLLLLFVVVLFVCKINLIQCMSQTDWDIRANIIQSTNYLDKNSNTEFNIVNKNIDGISNSLQENKQNEIEKQNFVTDCLESLLYCESLSGICKVDLEIFRTFCGDWTDERNLLGCQRKYVKECRSALRTMNHGRPNLKYCTCDSRPSRSIDDLTKCNLLRRNLNQHPCLVEPPILLRELPLVNNHYDQNYITTMKPFTSNKSNIINNSQPLEFQKENKSLIKSVSEKSKNDSQLKSQLITQTSDDLLTFANPNNQINDLELNITLFPNETVQNLTTINKNITCLNMLEMCTAHPSCARALNRFRALCNLRSCEKLHSQCLEAWHNFIKYQTHTQCDCNDELSIKQRYQRCLDYEEMVNRNKCVELSMTNNQLTTYSPPTDLEFPAQISYVETNLNNDKNFNFSDIKISPNEIIKQITDLNSVDMRQNIDCFTIFENCFHHPKCLNYFINLHKFCIKLDNNIHICRNTMKCIQTLQKFYTDILELIPNLIQCSCNKSDYDCKKIHQIFMPSCIEYSYGVKLDCFQIWIECQTNHICRTNYDLLITECQNPDGMCSTNPLNCINAYKQLWNGKWAGGCNCETNNQKHFPIVQYGLPGCYEFRKVLTKPPCSNMNTGQMNKDQNLRKDSTMSTCDLQNKLHMNVPEFIRISANEFTRNTITATGNCTLLCSCSHGCKYEMCYGTGTQTWYVFLLSTNQTQYLNYPTRIQTMTIYRPNLSMACIYLPKINQQCSCYSHGRIVCQVHNKLEQYIYTGNQIIIDFDVDLIANTIYLLNYNQTFNEYKFYEFILNLDNLLTNFMKNLIHKSICHLIFTSYQLLNSNGLNKYLHDYQTRMNRQQIRTIGRLEFLLVINSNNHKLNFKQNNTELCINTLEALNFMINEQYPKIRHHPILSTFRQSFILTTKTNSDDIDHVHNKTNSIFPKSINNDNMDNSIFIDQTQTWRHTRTSVVQNQKFNVETNSCYTIWYYSFQYKMNMIIYHFIIFLLSRIFF